MVDVNALTKQITTNGDRCLAGHVENTGPGQVMRLQDSAPVYTLEGGLGTGKAQAALV